MTLDEIKSGKDIYTCRYVNGGGTEYNAGFWQKKETAKTITFIYIDKLHCEPDYKKVKVKKETKNVKSGDIRYYGYGDVLIDNEDDTYTAYPAQCGTPYLFEPTSTSQVKGSKPAV